MGSGEDVSVGECESRGRRGADRAKSALRPRELSRDLGEIARATAIEARTLAVDVARGSPRASTVLSGSNFLTSSSAMASSRICFATRATVSARHVAILRRLVAAMLSRIPAARRRRAADKITLQRPGEKPGAAKRATTRGTFVARDETLVTPRGISSSTALRSSRRLTLIVLRPVASSPFPSQVKPRHSFLSSASSSLNSPSSRALRSPVAPSVHRALTGPSR